MAEINISKLGTMYFPSWFIKQEFKGATSSTLQIKGNRWNNLDNVGLYNCLQVTSEGNKFTNYGSITNYVTTHQIC